MKKKLAKTKNVKPPVRKNPLAWIGAEIVKGRINYVIQDDCGVPGTLALVAITPNLPYPVGIVWLQWRNAETVTIMNIWTFEPLRQCGVAKFLHSQIQKLYPKIRWIVSQDATELGTAWMEKMGYVKGRVEWRHRVKRKVLPDLS